MSRTTSIPALPHMVLICISTLITCIRKLHTFFFLYVLIQAIQLSWKIRMELWSRMQNIYSPPQLFSVHFFRFKTIPRDGFSQHEANIC